MRPSIPSSQNQRPGRRPFEGGSVRLTDIVIEFRGCDRKISQADAIRIQSRFCEFLDRIHRLGKDKLLLQSSSSICDCEMPNKCCNTYNHARLSSLRQHLWHRCITNSATVYSKLTKTSKC